MHLWPNHLTHRCVSVRWRTQWRTRSRTRSRTQWRSPSTEHTTGFRPCPGDARRALQILLTCAAIGFLPACQNQGSATPQLQGATPGDALSDKPTGSSNGDLTNDSLEPPASPSLSITSRPGFLDLNWHSERKQQAVSLFEYDTLTGTETLLAEYDESARRSATLPSRTHLRAWHRTQWRVEVCDEESCISSQRQALTEHAGQTIRALRPSVFVENERFAQHAALNQDASLLASALPVEGSIELYFIIADESTAGQRLRLRSTELSTTRQLTLALSSNGDTLAVLISDPETEPSRDIRIIERLGEAWVETGALTVPTTATPALSPVATSAARSPATLAVSADGNRIFLSDQGVSWLYRRQSTNWSDAHQLSLRHQPAEDAQSATASSSPAFTARFDEQALLRASTTSPDMDRVYTLHSLDQTLWLSLWRPSVDASADASAEERWTKKDAWMVSGFAVDRGAAIQVEADGSRIVIAGWEPEPGSSGLHTPILWRFEIPESTGATPSMPLDATDSLRMPPTEHAEPLIRLSADSTLNTLVLGWHTPGELAPDASVSTYRYDDTLRRWLPLMELPEIAPTLAKSAFAELLVLSADGSTLIMGDGQGLHQTPADRAGVLMVLQ